VCVSVCVCVCLYVYVCTEIQKSTKSPFSLQFHTDQSTCVSKVTESRETTTQNEQRTMSGAHTRQGIVYVLTSQMENHIINHSERYYLNSGQN
jgi:triosephosphate isomerase